MRAVPAVRPERSVLSGLLVQELEQLGSVRVLGQLVLLEQQELQGLLAQLESELALLVPELPVWHSLDRLQLQELVRVLV